MCCKESQMRAPDAELPKEQCKRGPVTVEAPAQEEGKSSPSPASSEASSVDEDDGLAKPSKIPQLVATALTCISFFMLGGLCGVLGPSVPMLATTLGAHTHASHTTVTPPRGPPRCPLWL
jgi:hypothetical protein